MFQPQTDRVGFIPFPCVVCRFVNLLLSHMSVEELREEACDCLFEIVNKGMDPVDKTKLVESLSQVLQSAGFFNVKQVPAFHQGLYNGSH